MGNYAFLSFGRQESLTESWASPHQQAACLGIQRTMTPDRKHSLCSRGVGCLLPLLTAWTPHLCPCSLENPMVQGSRSSSLVPGHFGPAGCLCVKPSFLSPPKRCWRSPHEVSKCGSGCHKVATIFLVLGSLAELYLLTWQNSPHVCSKPAQPVSVTLLSWGLRWLHPRILREVQKERRPPLSAASIPHRTPGVSQG